MQNLAHDSDENRVIRKASRRFLWFLLLLFMVNFIDRTNVGFAVGGGAEVKLDRHWSVKAEYLYVDLGTRTINTTDIDGAPFSVSYKVRDHIARLGLNYAFGGP